MKRNNSLQSWFNSLTRFAVIGSALGIVSAVQAAIISNPTDIANFKSGAIVENFDNLTALSVSSYTPVQTTLTFSTRDKDNAPTYDTGGATPTNPASNPGAPVAVLAPTGGIAGDVASPNNVIGPALPADFGNPTQGPHTALGINFMEVAMPAGKDAIQIGLFVTHGTVLVQVQDDNLQTLESQVVTAGNYVGFTRASADIRNVSIVGQLVGGVPTIDDFTYAFTASTGGGGGGGGGGNTVPDTGHALNLALAGCFIGLTRWKLRSRSA